MSKHIILCAGQNGRVLIYGRVDSDPTPGEPVHLTDARMVIYYPSGGSFGLAASGPPHGARVTQAIPETVETVWQEWMACTDTAVEAFDAHDPE